MSSSTLLARFLLVLFCSIASLQSIEAQEKPIFRLRQAYPKLLFLDPVHILTARDSSNRMYVVEKAGIIRVFDNSDSVDSTSVFLDIRSRVMSDGDAGLLGLAFHPDFASNGYFYVNYNAHNPLRTVIARYQVNDTNPQMVDTNSEVVLLKFGRETLWHNGGQLAFGTDGYLYISSGDGYLPKESMNKRSLLGKFLRIDVDTVSTNGLYSIPPDNPFASDTTGLRQEIFAIGLRNPWRFSIDSETGTIWAGDVGQDTWEEVNIIENGKNYGWNTVEGFDCFPSQTGGCDTAGLTMPVWVYKHNLGLSITGGYVYRGKRIPDLVGEYVYGDFASGWVWGIHLNDTSGITHQWLVQSGVLISAFGIDADNELYLCAYNEGKIYTFDAPLDTADTSDVTPIGSVPGSDKSGMITVQVNEPNPFSTSTLLHYTLTRGGHVQLIIHDMLGRVIATLVDGFQNAGQHRVQFDGSLLPAGIYSYTLVAAGAHKASGRMTIMR